LFGGGTGAGKSTILNNLIIKSALTGRGFVKDSDQKKVYVYITLENTIEESLMRTYQPLFGRNHIQVLQDISSGVDIKKKIVDELNKNNVTIVMKYFQPMSISAIDIMGVLDDIIEEYGKGSITSVTVDYLDLLRTDVKYDLYRLELGHITLALKTLAVQYSVPVITATQLGRSAYRIKDSKELNLDQTSESIKKVEHADFVCLLAKSESSKDLVYAKVGKNRSGTSNISIDFKVNFDIFKFISGTKSSNIDKVDMTSDQLFNFKGMESV
jgi:replicative DNA helicase